MADNNKSGDNRLYQLVIVLITAVIGPLTVFFVTNNASKANQTKPPEPTAVVASTVSPVSTASATTAVTLTSTFTPTQATAAPSLTPSATMNPKGPFAAGTTILLDGLAVKIDPADLQTTGPMIGVKIQIQNQGKEARTLSFTSTAVTLQDDARKTYQPYFGDKKTACKKTDTSLKKTIQLAPQQTVILQTADPDKANQWCDPNANQVIPLFMGPVSKNAHLFRLTLNGIGPFQGTVIEFKR